MKWFIYAPLQLVCMIVCYLTNWIVVLFADQNGELPGLLWLWQTWDDSLDSEDCVTKYVPSIIRYDFYKYYRVERHLLPEYNRWHKYSINIAPLPLIDRIKRYCCRVFGFTEIAHMALRLNSSAVMFRRIALKSMRTTKPANMNYIMRRQEITGCYTVRYRLTVILGGEYI